MHETNGEDRGARECTPLMPEFCLSLGMEALSLIKGDQIVVTSLRGSTMLLIIDAMKVNESEFADLCTILVKILQGCLYKSQLFDEIPSSRSQDKLWGEFQLTTLSRPLLEQFYKLTASISSQKVDADIAFQLLSS